MKEVSDFFSQPNQYRWQGKAILAVQEATEVFMVRLFEDAYVILLFPTLLSVFFILNFIIINK